MRGMDTALLVSAGVAALAMLIAMAFMPGRDSVTIAGDPAVETVA